jgi:LmbE family N-acetylglucosaminyl deacetylase
MKRTQRSRTKTTKNAAAESIDSLRTDLVVFGAHPDDIEFGCGGLVAKETRAGRRVHFVICSRGEAASNGTPAQRTTEAVRAAALLGASLEFLELEGDAHLDVKAAHAIKLAAILRLVRPTIVLAPTPRENQHPDHGKLGRLVRDACRLARYGGLDELRDAPVHKVDVLFFYAISPDAEPRVDMPVMIDISDPEVVATWKAAMEAHVSQMLTRNYVEMQLARARLHGLRAGVEYVTPLWPNDSLVFGSLADFRTSTRSF